MASKQRQKKSSPAVPPWMKESWETGNAKERGKLTMRDVDAVISEVRAGKRPKTGADEGVRTLLCKARVAYATQQAKQKQQFNIQ